MKVKFLPQEVEIEIQQGQTVMDLAHKNNIPIRSTCNGMPSCAECRVKVTDGDWNTNPPSRKELGLIGTGYYIDQRRLSCQMLCFGDITVDTTEQVEKSAEGPVTKKFLTKVHKETAAQSHSLGGVMLEENNQLLHELQNDVSDAPAALTAASLEEGRKNKHRDRDRGRNRGGGNRDQRDNRGGGQGGGQRDNRQQQARGGHQGGQQNRGGPPNQNRGLQQPRQNGGQFHNPAGNNIPANAPHPEHIDGTASPEMSAGADIGGDRGDGGGGQRRRRRRGGRGRNRGGGGGQGGGGRGPGGGGQGGGGNSGGGGGSH